MTLLEDVFEFFKINTKLLHKFFIKVLIDSMFVLIYSNRTGGHVD